MIHARELLPDLIRGRKGGGGKGGSRSTPTAAAPSESPNTLRSKAFLAIADLWCEGEIVGLAAGPQSIFLDQTPLMAPNGAWNFSGISYDVRNGLPDQPYMNISNGTEAEISVGVQVKANQPIIRNITDPDLNGIKVTVRIPSLMQQMPDGSLIGNTVSYRLEVRYANGPWINYIGDQTISGKCTSPYDQQKHMPLPINPAGASAPWQLRMTRLTADSTLTSVQNDTYLSSYTEVIDSKFTYPNTAYIGMVVDSEQFGQSIPQRSYLIDGRIILVPSNYNPTTRAYSGIWNGTFQEAYSNNPAWVLYDILSNDRFGLGEDISVDQIDKWSLYEIAQYCDQLVPNGFGGWEPRFTFNGVLTSQQEAYDAVQSIASCFRGMTYWSTGMVMATQDRPAEVEMMVSPSNVIDGEFNYVSTALKARHTVAVVQWNDPNDFYRAAYEVVADNASIVRYGRRQADVQAVGCTSRGQAHRMGLWTIASENLETQTLTYKAGLDHSGIRPGAIIAVQDPAFAGIDYAGRLVSSSTKTVLNLDHSVTFESGKTYTVMVALPSGKIEEKGVIPSALNVPTRSITLGAALSETPDNGGSWMISTTTLVPQLYRVIGIKEDEPHIYSVTATQHEPSKFDTVDFGKPFDPLDTSDFPKGAIAPVTNITTSEFLIRSNNSVENVVTVSAVAPKDPRVTQFQFQVRPHPTTPNNIWPTTSTLSGSPSVDIAGLGSGVFDFRVRSVSNLGIFSVWVTKSSVTLNALLQPPPNVDDFNIAVIGSQTMLTWTISDDINVAYYEIRHSPNTDVAPTWNAATLLVKRALGTSIQIPTLTGSFLIKAVSFAGVYSVQEKIITSSLVSLEGMNVVEDLNQEPAWAGNKTNITNVNGTIYLSALDFISSWERLSEVGRLYVGTGLQQSGIYEFDDVIDLGAVYTSRLTASMVVYGQDFTSSIFDWQTLASVERMNQVTSDMWKVELQIRTTQVNPSDSTGWTDWKPFQVGDFTARAFDFRLLMSSTNIMVSPAMSQLHVRVDMPDRILAGNDNPVPTGGLRVDFTPPMHKFLGLSVADQNMSSGDYRTITSKDETGFNIAYHNSAGTPVARTFDWVAKGYGVKQD